MMMLAVSMFAQGGGWVQVVRVNIKALRAMNAPGVPASAQDQIQVMLRDGAGVARPAYMVRVEGLRNGAPWSMDQTVSKFPDEDFGRAHAMASFFVEDEKAIVIQRIIVTPLAPQIPQVHE
jgi:hypothetical protein